MKICDYCNEEAVVIYVGSARWMVLNYCADHDPLKGRNYKKVHDGESIGFLAGYIQYKKVGGKFIRNTK
jgi:hypothetical protein